MVLKTLCPYCGCGCSLLIQRKPNLKFLPNPKDPISKGNPCIKGLTAYELVFAKDRIFNPLIRKGKKLVKTNWETAYKYIYKNTKNLSPDEVCFLASSPASNESCFLFQKFAREYFKTDNVDSCARICHAASCYAFAKAFGITRMPAKFNDYEKADCILLIGTNPLITYPVIFNRILKAKKNGAKLIHIRYFPDETSKYADVFIKIEDSTELVLLNCLLNLISKNLEIPEYVRDVIKHYTPEFAARICKCDKKLIKKAARLIEKSKKFVLGYGMGLTQHIYGSNNVFSAINLVIAKKGKIISMRGKANIQGVNDMGCVPKASGRTMVKAIATENPVKAVFVMQMDPAKSLPALNIVRKRLAKAFVVEITPFPTETTKFADVVLPCCLWLEEEGSFTNAESRVRYFPEILAAPKNVKPGWKIIKDLAKVFGLKWKYKNITDIWKDINKINEYEDIKINELKRSEKGKFVKYKIKVKNYFPVEFSNIEEKTSKKFPFVLTTERWQYRFCGDELSSRSPSLTNLQKYSFVLINKEDASQLNIKDGEIVKIISKFGSVKSKIKISENVPRGLVIAPFHFSDLLINKLFGLEFDITGEVNLKRVAVRLEKL